jgi:hypothetical protein
MLFKKKNVFNVNLVTIPQINLSVYKFNKSNNAPNIVLAIYQHVCSVL